MIAAERWGHWAAAVVGGGAVFGGVALLAESWFLAGALGIATAFLARGETMAVLRQAPAPRRKPLPWLARPAVRRRAIVAITGVVVLAYYFTGQAAGAIGPEQARAWVEGAGILGPITLILLIAAAMVFAPVPNGPFPVAAGLLWGMPMGIAYALAGQALGAFVVFNVSRRFGRRFLPRLVGERAAERIDFLSLGIGPQVVFWARIAPFIPLDVAAYAAGLTAMRFRPFFIAFMLGSVPPTILAVWLGHSLTGSWAARIVSVGAVLLFLGGASLAWVVRSRGSIPRPGELRAAFRVNFGLHEDEQPVAAERAPMRGRAEVAPD